MAAEKGKGLFYYVVDRSGSITAYGLTEPIRRAITEHVAQLPEETEVRLAFFSRDSSEPKRWASMTPDSRIDFAEHFKQSFLPDGPTRLYDTVGEVMEEIRAAAEDYRFVSILVFSDGENNWSRTHRSWNDLEPLYYGLVERHEQSFIYWITLEFDPAVPPPSWITHEPQPPGTTDIPIPEPAPLAEFTAYPQQLKVGESVQFEYGVRGGRVNEFVWDFGDGNSSFDQNPVHQYAEDGSYTVTLQTLGPGGEAKEVKPGLVEVVPVVALAANFRAVPERPRIGDELKLQDLSEGNPEVWEWRLNGEVFSTDAAPTLTAEQAGEMRVSLTVRRRQESATSEQVLTVLPLPPVAGFTILPEEATFGEAVVFAAEETQDGWNHRWVIDSDLTLEGNRVEWVSDRHGLLHVVHTVEAPGGFSRNTDRVFVHAPVEVLPDTKFSIQPRVFTEGDIVTFRAQETEEGRTHQWLVDGAVVAEGAEAEWASDQIGNLVVTHRIRIPGTEATFEAWDEMLGRKPELVRVKFAASRFTGTYPLQVDFADESEGEGVIYRWNFGDGTTSELRNPSHLYEEPGDYNVVLEVTNREGIVTSNVEPVVISVAPPMPLWQKIGLGILSIVFVWVALVVPFILRPMLAPQKGPKLVGVKTYPLYMSVRQGWSRYLWPKSIVSIGSAVDSDIRLPNGGGTRGDLAQIERTPAAASYSIRPLAGNEIYKIEKQTSLTNPDTEEKSKIGRARLLRDGDTYEIGGERLIWCQPRKRTAKPQSTKADSKVGTRKSRFAKQKKQPLARGRN